MPDPTLDTKAVLIDQLYRICDEAPVPSPEYGPLEAAKLTEAFKKIVDLIEPYASQL